MKCSKCGEVWHQEPDTDELIEGIEKQIEDIPESVRPIREGSSVPVVREEDKEEKDDGSNSVALGYAMATGVFVLILAALVFMKTTIVNAYPQSIAIYNLIGMDVPPPGQGLEFDRVMAVVGADGQVTVDGWLLNLTADDKPVPTIEASIKDELGETLASWLIPAPADTLPAEETVEFHAAHAAIDNMDSLHLRFTFASVSPAAEEAQSGDMHHETHEDSSHEEMHHEERHDDAEHEHH